MGTTQALNLLVDLPDGGVAAFLDKDMNLVAKGASSAVFVRVVYEDGRSVFGAIVAPQKNSPVVSLETEDCVALFLQTRYNAGSEVVGKTSTVSVPVVKIKP